MIVLVTTTCARCGEAPRVWGAYCRSCGKEMARASRKVRDNRGRACSKCSGTVTARTGYLCAGCTTKKDQRARAADSTLSRRGYLKQRYGLSLEQYDLLLEKQGGVCAICHKSPPSGGNPLCVDHDHSCCPGTKTCGACIRGLLCVYCNSTVGKLENGSFEPHLTYIAESRMEVAV